MSNRCHSCEAPVRWVRTASGKAMPIDPEPVDGGNVWLDSNGVAHVGDEQWAPSPRRYKSHFATCPNAAKHRRPR